MFFKRRKNNPNYIPSREKSSPKSGLSKSSRTSDSASKPDRSILRIKAVVFIFCFIWVGLWGRAWYLQMIEGPRLAEKAKRQHMATELIAGKRGRICDRNGQVMARSVEVSSIYARPQEIVDIPQTVAILAPILGVEAQKLKEDLTHTKRRFVWLKRKVDDYAAEQIRKANLSGIGLSREYDRIYPFNHMSVQLLGFVGLDDKGLEGLERSLEGRLGCVPVRQIVQRDAMGRKFYLHDAGMGEPKGEDLTLTLDLQVQFIAEEACARVAREFDGRWSGALIVEIASGDILAWAQYPFFNPNSYKTSTPLIYRNRLASDALEPGSTFKPLVMAAALEEGKITPNTLINCEGGKWENRNITIRDTSIRGILPASKVLRYSSNIGMAKIGLGMGPRQFHKYLQSMGFGERTRLPVSESRGILRQPRDWSEADIMATSFGQSISVTALQMAQAYLALLNNGIYKPLRLIREEALVEEAPRRIFNEKTVHEVMDMMRDVVQAEDGTGKRARLEGIEVGGKTGTAQKVDHKSATYGSKRLASFVGFFPANEPKYLVLVMVDEPTRNQYGGIVAAPAFKEIAGRLLTYTGFLNESRVDVKSPEKNKKNTRSLKLASLESPWLVGNKASFENSENIKVKTPEMRLPGHLAKAASQVPDVTGKSLRNAVELFARAGIVPELKGSGARVIKQSPPPGSAWIKNGGKMDYILWLSEL